MSDSTESVSGVSSLGILHAPGYPSYVLFGKAFSLLFPVGGLPFRLNVFSLVCASLSVAGVQLLARRCGAPRWAATLAAIALAASAGFWFYAVFAKHDAFSGLALLVSIHMLLAWEMQPTARRAAGLCAAYAVGLGASWPLMISVAPAFAFVLIRSRRKLTLRAASAGLSIGGLVLAACYGFVLVRASQNPAVNWGHADSLSRLIALITRRDFTTGSSLPPAPKAAALGAHFAGFPPSGAIRMPPVALASANLLHYVWIYLVVFWRELTATGALLALWGLAMSVLRRRGAMTWFLLAMFLGNLLAVIFTAGLGSDQGYSSDLIEEGFLFGCYFSLVCWIALGAADLLERVRGLAAKRAWSARLASGPGLGVLAGPLAALVLVPSIIGHWKVAHAEAKPFTNGYAAAVFGELPQHAALFVAGSDLNLPLEYRQVVFHDRRDVIVVAIGGLRFDWYRQQISRQLGQGLPPQSAGTGADAARVIGEVLSRRPTYLDPQAFELLKTSLSAQPVGILDRVVSPSHPVPALPPATLERNLLTAERQAMLSDPAWGLWPNQYLRAATFTTAALRVARAYYERHDLVGMRRLLENVVTIDPTNPTAQQDLTALGQTALP